ncbi:MAG: hypothetical protein VR70_04075 [Rhodospirillaceae bacterium BRH_c57]|nr:MAG: hypothetical protein VR70_04075 [Rhodospirillaceae bacterium BRH_c57]
MKINLTITDMQRLAEEAYSGSSDVLTVSRKTNEDVRDLNWWTADRGKKQDRGWRGTRDWAGLRTYLEAGRRAVDDVPENYFPRDFDTSDGRWCRPDKDIIKQGIRVRYLEPWTAGGQLMGFRVTAEALCLLDRIFPVPLDEK